MEEGGTMRGMLHRISFTETRLPALKVFLLAAVGEDVVLTVRNFNDTSKVVEQLMKVTQLVPIVEHGASGSLVTYPPFREAGSGRLAIVTASQIQELQQEHDVVVKKDADRQREESQGLIRDLVEQLRGMVKGTPLSASQPAPAPLADRLLQVTFPATQPPE
jgi:hypothetical protein